jgi:hypothetical protein
MDETQMSEREKERERESEDERCRLRPHSVSQTMPILTARFFSQFELRFTKVQVADVFHYTYFISHPRF